MNLAFYLAKDDVLDVPVGVGLQLALDLILFVMAVMAGRVIPMFTENGDTRRGRAAARMAWTRGARRVLLLVAADAADAPEDAGGAGRGHRRAAHGARSALAAVARDGQAARVDPARRVWLDRAAPRAARVAELG